MAVQEYITFEQVMRAVGELNTSADVMQEVFDNVTKNMTNMTQQDNWQGVSSDATFATFKKYEAKFADFVNTVKKFGQALNISEEQLQALEDHLKKQAEG